MQRRVVVSVHAHPDDEALLCGGTLARLSAAGHRVVLVVATDGEAGLAEDAERLGARRREELAVAAGALGVARTVTLGLPDSGMAGDRPGGLASRPVEELASAVAEVLREEQADVVTGYDPRGGYGHPDHLAVHRAVRQAKDLAGTPRLLEATVDREALARVQAVLSGLRLAKDPGLAEQRWTPRAEITHKVDVRPWLEAKRRAMAAHASQVTGGGDVRTLALLLKLPAPLFRRAVGTEWFTDPDVPARPLRTDPLAGAA